MCDFTVREVVIVYIFFKKMTIFVMYNDVTLYGSVCESVSASALGFHRCEETP